MKNKSLSGVNTNSGSFALFARYAKQHGGSIITLTLVYIMSTALLVLAPQALRGFIDSVHGSYPLRAQILAIGLYLAAMLTQALTEAVLDYQLASVGQRITDSYRRDVISRYLSLEARNLSGMTSGEILTRLNNDAQGLFSYYYILLYKLAGSALALTGILAVLVTHSLMLCAILGTVCVMTILGFKVIQDRGIPKYVRRAKAASAYNSLMKEILDNSPSLRALGAERYAEEKTVQAMRNRFRESFPASLMYANLWSASTVMQGLVAGTGLLLASFLWDSGSVTLGTVYLIYIYSNLIITPLQDFRNHMGNMQSAKAGILRTQEFLDTPRTIKSGNRLLKSGALEVSVENLSFAYEKDREVLRNISFGIQAGGRTGIMGETGCGKSTLLSLIARLNSFDKGVINLGGIDIHDIDLKNFRERVAYCTQRVQLIHGTIRDNITLFDEKYTAGDIDEAIRQLGLSEWFAKFSGGLDTELEMGEANLSSGEAQLIALVRLFIRQPGLVLLDEISSNLDPAAEKRVTGALKTLCEGRTVLAIAHRKEALAWMDTVIHMEDGRIVESETRKPIYAKK